MTKYLRDLFGQRSIHKKCINAFWDEMTLVSSNGPLNIHGLIVVFHMTQEIFTVAREGHLQFLQVKPTVFLP